MNNGWTPTVLLKTRLENLLAQIPPEHQARAAAICVCENPNDFERNLTSYVLSKKWLLESGEQPHPAEVAYELDKAMSAELPAPSSPWRYSAKQTFTRQLDGQWKDVFGYLFSEDEIRTMYDKWLNPQRSDVGKYRQETAYWTGDLYQK